MRSIKFRGFTKDDPKMWFYGDLVRELSTKKTFILDISYIGECRQFHDLAVEVLPETVSQFTGLKDKNEKEIYEGDICKFSDWKPKEIKWVDGRFMLGNTLVICCKMECDEMEVIGNIHEHKHLLEVEKV